MKDERLLILILVFFLGAYCAFGEESHFQKYAWLSDKQNDQCGKWFKQDSVLFLTLFEFTHPNATGFNLKLLTDEQVKHLDAWMKENNALMSLLFQAHWPKAIKEVEADEFDHQITVYKI